MRGGLEALLVQHLGHRVGVGADVADLAVDGERHGLLGEEEGQRAADQSEEDEGEQAELERAAHNTSTGHRTRAGERARRRGRRARRGPGSDGSPAGARLRPVTPPGSVSTPAVGHDTITNTVRVATVHSE